MTTLSTIMDTNSFRIDQDTQGLDAATRRLTEKRHQVLGGAYRLFYRNPVHLVRGKGQYVGCEGG
jgi:hypothetical protein